MAHDYSKTKPLGGLDGDSSSFTIDALSYRYAKNIRNAINNAARGGELTNIQGNVEITKYALPYNADVFPTGRNKVIGSIEDTKYNTVIYFVWNSLGKHQILRYYRDLTSPTNPYGEVQQIIQYDFGWTKRTRIDSANLVYGTQEAGADSELTGDLLYWCDKEPRKINITKANICTKQKSWDVFLPVTCDLPNTVTFTFKNFAGTVINDTIVALSDPTNRETIISDITAYINGLSGVPVTAESCDCHLSFTEKVSGTVWTIEVDTDLLLIPPKNWYGAELIIRFFDRCKYPPLQAPRGTFLQDENYEPNYVQKKVFQFRLEYDYDDLERSALGVWSQIPINNLGCDGTSNPLLNYIDVNFEDSQIAVDTTLVLLKRIRFIARELNTGTDRSVIELTPCEFLDYDYDNNVWYCHFKFYNDIISSSIDAATAAKLFDNVPLESNDERFVKNRIIEGGILEGYDAPDCIAAKPQMEFGDTPNPRLVKITGKIKIMSYTLGLQRNPNSDGTPPFYQRNFYETYPNFKKYPFWEDVLPDNNYVIRRGGIFHDVSIADSVPFFGGGGWGVGNNGKFGIRAGMESAYDQRLPEGGFPVYCAGTNYFTISKQISVGLSSDSVGSLDISTEVKIEEIGNYLNCDTGVCGDLYSTFELLVPENATYVIRLASHWCSFGDDIGKGFAYDLSGGTQYQQTSTNVWCIQDANGVQVKEKEITITVTDVDVDCGSFIVADLAPPWDANVTGDFGLYGQTFFAWQPINGYLVSGNGSDANDESFEGVAVEKTIVAFSANTPILAPGTDYEGIIYSAKITTPAIVPIGEPITLAGGWNEVALTDHNGYWFGIGGATMAAQSMAIDQDNLSLGKNYNYFPIAAYQTKIGNPNDVEIVRVADTLLYVGSLTDYYNNTLSATNFNGNDTSNANLVSCVVALTTPGARTNGSTIIDGRIIDQNNNGVEGIKIVYQNGGTSNSAASGDFSVFAWSDMITPNLGLFASQTITFVPISSANRIVDSLIVQGSIFCNITYPIGQFILVEIDPFDSAATGYNPTVHYDAGDFEINEGNNPSVKAHKRGGNYTYALRLYDDAGRLCSVVSAFEMYVPFITDDIGKYAIEDFSGVVYPSGTYKYGKPSIKWVLDSGTTFPTWATTFQWMRVKNSIYGRYLQWVANQVTYLSAVATASTPDIQTSFQNADAVAIKISISNITGYYAANNDSQVGYSYIAGDRLRLIANRTLVNYSGVNDFEITSYDSTTQSIVIKPNGFPTEILSGTLMEIFNPKSVATTDEQIFYEVGEVVGITNGIPDSFSGVFTNGDTYWRGRLIIVNDDATKFASAYPVVIEDASVSDFYVSEAQDIGRIGIIDYAFKQVYNPTKLRCSNTFLASTAINGLSSFDELNQKEFDRGNGQIERLLVRENTVIAVTSQREISNYIQVVTLEQAQVGNGVLAISNQYFGTEYPHAKRLGTDLPSSVIINDGKAFGFQSKRGETWRYQGDGEVTTSEAKMINYFFQLELDGVSDATAVYDRRYEEYILTLWRNSQYESTIYSYTPVFEGGALIGVFYPTGTPLPQLNSDVEFQYFSNGIWNTLGGVVNSITDAQDGNIVNIVVATRVVFTTGIQVNIACSLPETIVWFDGQNGITKERWMRFDDRTPEKWEQIGSELVSFLEGGLWIEDKNVLYNNFYGVQYETYVTPVFNKNPDLLKVWNAVTLQQFQADNGCNWSAPNIYNDNGQESRINNAGFVKKGEIWYAPFKRDLNDITFPANLRISQGRVLRSTFLVCELKNDSTGEVRLFSWDGSFTLSQRTGK